MDAQKVLLYSGLAVISIAIVGRIAIDLLVPGGRVTSWWRSPSKNKAVGGKPNSRHLWGWGYDVVPVTPANERALRKFFPVVVNEKDHIHVQLV